MTRTEIIKPAKIDATSKEFVKCKVEARRNGVIVDPTADVVAMAFTLTESATGASFYSGSWETDEEGLHYARCLVGPGAGTTTLTAGKRYYVWVKVTDSPEVPVKAGGQIEVT